MMNSVLPGFSQAQWKFLATVEALGGIAPIDAVVEMAPLMPSELLDLIRRAEHNGLLQKTANDYFGLAPDIPSDVLSKLQSFNSPDRVSEIFVHLKDTGWLSRLSQPAIIPLLMKANRFEEVVTIRLNLTKTAIDHLNMEDAIANLSQVIKFHLKHPGHSEIEKRLIDHALTASNLSAAMGKGFTAVQPLLRKLLLVSESSGDRRSHAMILLHLGRLYYLSFMNTEFLKAFSAGKQIVDELGDEDILFQSAEFVGLYYFVQGDFKQAMIHYERASEWSRYTENKIINPFAPVFFCLTTMALGQFARAFNLMDIFHRIAVQKNLPSVATTLRAVLGYMLLTFHKNEEALHHLTIAETEGTQQHNELGLFAVRLFKSYYHYLKGDLPEARDLLLSALRGAAVARIISPYAVFPWVLEMLFEFDKHHIEIPAEYGFDGSVQRVKQDLNICLKGVLMRLLAKRAAANGESTEQIKGYLEKSLHFLVRSGPVVQLARTQLALARFELTYGNRETASMYARQAWDTLPINTKRLFPDDLQHLIENISKGPFLKSFLSPEIISNRFSGAIEKLIPALDLKVILHRLVSTTNRFFSAERGAFFLWHKNGKMVNLELAAAVNLTELEVRSSNFNPNIKKLTSAIRSGEPLITDLVSFPSKKKSSAVNTAVLCLPIDLGNDLKGVLYHDNSFLKDSFDYLDSHTLALLKTHLQTLSRQLWDFYSSAQKKIHQASEKEIETEYTLKERIIGESPEIRDLLEKAKRIADTDSPILIQGETGAGKEILARWAHMHSPRQGGPYVIIDATTISENLLESELFGHEKGAFTGAVHQKAGRVELAHGGTLFLDEVGELPLSMQAKLLRVLEEKTFVRVGGSRVHRCDFRLIAATNRDLEKEVHAGRFREDLFYRLNVLPIQIPPLRERGEDIILLARHFLKMYCKQLKRPPLNIAPEKVVALRAYSWPGNVRELKNVIERGTLLSTGNQLELQLSSLPADRQSFSVGGKPSMDELQRRYIRYILKTTDGRIGGPGGAADILEMNRTTLYYRMKRLGMPLTLTPGG